MSNLLDSVDPREEATRLYETIPVDASKLLEVAEDTDVLEELAREGIDKVSMWRAL